MLKNDKICLCFLIFLRNTHIHLYVDHITPSKSLAEMNKYVALYDTVYHVALYDIIFRQNTLKAKSNCIIGCKTVPPSPCPLLI